MSRTTTLPLFPSPLPAREPPVVRYQRHQPEQTLLYRLIEQHYPVFLDHLDAQNKTLPEYITREFDDYLKCGRLEHGFLRVRCSTCRHEQLVAFSCKRRGFCPSCGARRMAESAALLVDAVLPRVPMRQWVLSVPFPLRFLFASAPSVLTDALGIITRALSTHLIQKAGYSPQTAYTGAVTLIQRFGSSLNLNIHFHILCLDGVFVDAKRQNQKPDARLTFHRLLAPTREELTTLLHTISVRLARSLERRGLLTRDAENSYLARDEEDEAIDTLRGSSITYRIAVGPHPGRKVFTLQTLPPTAEETTNRSAVALEGFSLHAAVVTEAHEREKLERLVRYIARPALAEQRLSVTPHGLIRYQLKAPHRDGTTHVLFEPLDFVSRLATLIPPPRLHLIRFHGVFAPNHHQRARIIPRPSRPVTAEEADTPISTRATLTWAQRLKRVFTIDIQTCPHCQGSLKVIGCIDDPALIEKVLMHLARKAIAASVGSPALARAPPAEGAAPRT